MLWSAMLIVAVSFAQVQPQNFRSGAQAAVKPMFKPQVTFEKGAPAAEWFGYMDVIYSYLGSEIETNNLTVALVATDSNGLMTYSDGNSYYNTYYGAGQTFDFTHYIWEEGFDEGNISMVGTTSYNIDSVLILGHYNRGSLVPAENVDTLIVSILTINEQEVEPYSVVLNNGDTTISFYAISYDPATQLAVGSINYKIPLYASDCSETADDGILYYSYFYFPINMNDITDKVVNITYTFKRGYTMPVDDNTLDHSYFYGWFAEDFRDGYLPYDYTTWSWIQPDDEILHNQNQGTLITNYNLNQSYPGYYYTDYFYPLPIWNALVAYPFIYTRISCNDCAIVNVQDIENNNITVYPNPATNNFTVNLGNDEQAHIQLYNLIGQEVYNETIKGSTQVNVSNLNSGIYMLKVNYNGNVSTTKVVVK